METPSFGTIARSWRKACGLTQADAAHRLGVAQPTVSKIERDERLPTTRILASMGELYALDDVTLASALRLACAEMAVTDGEDDTMPTVLDAHGRTLTDRVWLALDAEPWSTAADLAEDLGARPSSISNILQTMVNSGRAERVRARRQSSVARVWSYRLVIPVPEHLL